MSGFQSKRMIAFAGRGVGKSVWAQMVNDLTMPHIGLMASAEVDGKMWYTVQLSMPAREWLVTQDADQWYEHTGVRDRPWQRHWFDVHESLYTILMLKWK